MRKLLNTLYVTNPDVHLGAKGDNIVIRENGELKARFPLLNLENIVVFNYNGVSASLMHKCLERKIGLHFLSETGYYLYTGRKRRPPEDPLNACLSFAYTLLSTEVKNALTTVGLDPYIGFFHTDRPGRISLALDMMEELRGVMADRFVLSLINRGQINSKDFTYMESGAVLLSEDSRAKFLQEWHKYKQQKLTHPYLKEQVLWGLVPYTQALLLARYIRGDLDEYPAFCWK